MHKTETWTMHVSGKNNISATAGSITKALEEGKTVEIQVIGASANNQAVKSIAKARSYIASSGYDVIVRPGFMTTQIDGEERTGLRLLVDKV